MTTAGGVGIERDPCRERAQDRMGQPSVPEGMMLKGLDEVTLMFGSFKTLHSDLVCP